MITKNTQKTGWKTDKFVCHFCNYSTSRKSNFDRHVMTPKHRTSAKTSKNEQNEQNEQKLKNVKKINMFV